MAKSAGPFDAGNRWRRLVWRLALAGFSITIALGAIEAVLTFGLAHPGLLAARDGSAGRLLRLARFYYMNRERQILQMVDDCIRHDSEVSYTLRYGSACTIVGREHRADYAGNRAGLRDDESALDHPSIVAIGDSFTMGHGVSASETFSKVLQRDLGVPVLNAGISSYATAREFVLLQRLQLPAFGTLLIQYCENDLRENREFTEQGGHLTITPEREYRARTRAFAVQRGYYPFRHLVELTRLARLSLPSERPNADTNHEEAYYFLEVLRHFEPQIAGRTVLVFELNSFNENDGAFVRSVAEQITQARYAGIRPWVRTLDLSVVLRHGDYYVLDDHITAAGHAKIARQVAAELRPLRTAGDRPAADTPVKKRS